MSNLKLKFTRLFLPVAGIAVAMIVLYSAANAVLVAGGPIPLDGELVTYWLPGFIAFVLALFVLHPRMDMLALNEKRGIPFLFEVLAIAAIAVPTIFAQCYIGATTGTVAHVEDATRVAVEPQARFFTIRTPCFDRSKAVADVAYDDDDDRGDMTSVTLYVAVPACTSNVPAPASVWLGYTYQDTVSNRATDAERQAAIDALLRRTEKTLDAENFTHYRYFARAGHGNDSRALEKALRKNKIAGDAVILVPHAEAFADRGGRNLFWAAVSFGIGLLVWLIAVLAAPLRRTEDRVVEPVLAGAVDNEAVRELFIPRRDNYGIPLLLDINILVYLAMVLAGLGVMSFATGDLLAWGASYRPAIHGLGVLRLITSQFVHGGLLHLANNMQGFLFAALCLIPVAQNARLILCYLLCGLGGSIASVWHSVTVSVGASGAIFGLYGILLVLFALKDKRIHGLGPAIWTSAAIFVGLNLVFGFVSPATDNAAHVGGLLTGLVLGLTIFFIDRPRLHREAA